MPVDEGTRGNRPRRPAKVKPPPKKKAPKKTGVDTAVERAFGADVGIFVPPALIPPPAFRSPEADSSKVPGAKPRFKVKPTKKESREQAEAAALETIFKRGVLGTAAPVSVAARVKLRGGETETERKARTGTVPPPKRKDTRSFFEKERDVLRSIPGAVGGGLTAPVNLLSGQLARASEYYDPSRPRPRTGLGAVDALADIGAAAGAGGRGVERAAERLAEQGIDPLTGLFEPLSDAFNMALGGVLTPQAPNVRATSQGIQASPEQAGIVAPEIAKNFATGLAQAVAGAPVGAIMLLTDPEKVFAETKKQYAAYYGPLFRGDFDEFQKNLEEQPVQVVFDIWTALAVGLGASARAVTLGRTVRASPEQLAGVSRGAAIAQSILFKKQPYSVGMADGTRKNVFGQRPTVSFEDFAGPAGQTAKVQRMVPQSEVGQAAQKLWLGMAGGTRRRGRKLIREEMEQQAVRSRAELANFARRIDDYTPSVLDGAASIIGVSGIGRVGRTARKLEENRVTAARALATALDRLGVHGGDVANGLAKIETEIETRTARFAEEGGNLQARRVRDLRNAATIVREYMSDPTSKDAVQFFNDLAETRQLANETEARLIEMGMLNPDTAANLLDRQTRDVETIEQVPPTRARAELEDAMFRRWEGTDTPERVVERVATGLQMLDAAAQSFARRTGNDAADFYDDLISRVSVRDEVPQGALEQISGFSYGPPPEVAAANLAAKHNPATQKNGLQANKAVKRGGIVIVGKMTPKQWVDRVLKMAPDREERNFFARWYEIFEPLFREAFGEDADMVMRGFAVSQANDSPTGGLSAVLQVMDLVRRGEEVPKNRISLVADGIATAIRGEHIGAGMAAKLNDFTDNLDQKRTRSWMGHDPRGGYPTAIDIHAGRDLGWVDDKAVARLEKLYGLKKGVHYEVDMPGSSMSGSRYERAAEQYQAITDHLNSIEFDGRSDWLPDQVQALGWAVQQRILGEEPETLGFALGGNTRSIDFEVVGGPEGLGRELTHSQILEVQKEFEAYARDLAESQPNVYVREVVHDVGAWGGIASPSMHVRVIGSKQAVQDLTTKFAQAFRQGLVQASKEGGNKARAAVVIGHPDFADPDIKAEFFKRLYEADPRLKGMMPGELNGNPAIVIRTGSGRVNKGEVDAFLDRFESAVRAVESQMGLDVDYGARNIDLLIGDQAGEAPRTATEGRDLWSAGGVDDPLARTIGERLADAIARASRGEGTEDVVPVRVLSKGEAWEMEPQPGFLYHGTSETGADAILAERRLAVGRERQPEAVWFAQSPQLAAFHGDVVLEVPETVLPAGTRTLPLGVVASPDDVFFQWDFARWYETEPREPRGGALVREDGTEIVLGPGADLTTVVHEGAHAFLPEQLGWVTEFDPEWADEIARVLEIEEGGVIARRSQEIYAYSVEAWAALGRPPVTQLRERFKFYKGDAHDVYGRQVKIPDEYRAAVSKALEDPEYMAWLTDMWDPLYGMRAGEGSFFISRRPPLARNPFTKLRQRSGLGKPRDRVHARTGTLEEAARDELGPQNVLENAERWQRVFEQEEKIALIRNSGWATEIPRDRFGNYDFGQVPEGHEVFNPDGLKGWTRAESEADARAWDALEPSTSLEDMEVGPIELAERFHDASLQVANKIFTGKTPPWSDPRNGALYYIPSWVKEAYIQDMAGSLLNRAVLGTGTQRVLDAFKVMNAAQRLRMYLALRYVVLNVGATATLNTMHQGFFMPFNFGSALKIAHSNPDLLARLEAEVGTGFYEAITAGELSRGAPTWAQALEKTATAVGAVVSKPEAFLRSTSIIHHMKRAGFRSQKDMTDLLDAAKVNGEAKAYLNQIARWAEEDVVRFRGFPPGERDVLRAIFFVSGWLMAASRFALRYPVNHPFWTTMLAQLGDDGWAEMRERMAEFTSSTRYSLEVGEGKTSKGVEYTAQTDLGQWLPFGTGVDMLDTVTQFATREAQRRLLENFSSSAKFVYGFFANEDVYGREYTIGSAADEFMIANTPLDYVADLFPGAFKWFNHERTPSSLRVDQSWDEYMKEWALGRAYPTKYVKEKIEERWAEAMAGSGGAAARKVKDWTDKVEGYFGQPPDEMSVQAKTAMADWQSQWSRKQDEIESEQDKMLAEAEIKVAVMKKYGYLPEKEKFSGPSIEDVYAQIRIRWDATVGVANDVANEAWRVPKS